VYSIFVWLYAIVDNTVCFCLFTAQSIFIWSTTTFGRQQNDQLKLGNCVWTKLVKTWGSLHLCLCTAYIKKPHYFALLLCALHLLLMMHICGTFLLSYEVFKACTYPYMRAPGFLMRTYVYASSFVKRNVYVRNECYSLSKFQVGKLVLWCFWLFGSTGWHIVNENTSWIFHPFITEWLIYCMSIHYKHTRNSFVLGATMLKLLSNHSCSVGSNTIWCLV